MSERGRFRAGKGHNRPIHQRPNLHGADFKFRNNSHHLPNNPHSLLRPPAVISKQKAEAPLNIQSRGSKKKPKERSAKLKSREQKKLLRNSRITGLLFGAAVVSAACYADPSSVPGVDQVDSWKVVFEKNPLYYPQMLALFFGTTAGVSALITSGVKYGAKAANPNVHGYNWLNFGFDWGVDIVSDATVAGYQAASAMLMYEFGVADRDKIFEKIASQIPALAALGFGILAFNQFDKVKDVIGLFKFPQLAPAAPATEE